TRRMGAQSPDRGSARDGSVLGTALAHALDIPDRCRLPRGRVGVAAQTRTPMIPGNIPLPSLACAAAIAIAAQCPALAASPAESAPEPPTLVLVTGAGGEETFARQFESQTSAWREAGTKAGARIREAGS